MMWECGGCGKQSNTGGHMDEFGQVHLDPYCEECDQPMEYVGNDDENFGPEESDEPPDEEGGYP